MENETPEIQLKQKPCLKWRAHLPVVYFRTLSNPPTLRRRADIRETVGSDQTVDTGIDYTALLFVQEYLTVCPSSGSLGARRLCAEGPGSPAQASGRQLGHEESNTDLQWRRRKHMTIHSKAAHTKMCYE